MKFLPLLVLVVSVGSGGDLIAAETTEAAESNPTIDEASNPTSAAASVPVARTQGGSSLVGWNSHDWGSAPADTSDYATVLLYKFSNNKPSLTPDEFSYLLECSLGQVACPQDLVVQEDVLDEHLSDNTPMEDDAYDLDDAAYRVLTNCSTNTALSNIQCQAYQRCLTTSEMMQLAAELETGAKLLPLNTVGVVTLRRLLPLVVVQSQLQDCRGLIGYPVTDDPTAAENLKPSPLEVWGYGILFVTIISVCSLVGVSVLPLMARKLYQQLLTALIGLAAGSLAASSLFHLMPQAFNLPALYGNHDYLFTSLYVLLGLWSFLMIERIIKMAVTSHSRRNAEKPPAGHGHQSVEYHPGESSVIRTVAWMIIFGDGFHNFLDGVSIGAAFSQSKMTGISISLAVMAEELPHELGDFAVLLSAGMSMRQALMYNFLSATTCYAGLVVGILLGEFTQDSTYIFALAAGMFLYIACVDMLPELNEVINTACEKGTTKEVLWLLFLQNVGLAIGVFSLFFLAYYQDSITLGA